MPRKSKVPEMSPLEALTPQELKLAHLAGQHEEIRVIACILCIRRAGGRIEHVEDVL